MAFAVLAWAYCIFSLQGNSQDLYTGSGIQRHASFILLLNGVRESGTKTIQHAQTNQKMLHAVSFCGDVVCHSLQQRG